MEIYTREEAAEILKISVPTLDRLIAEGELEVYKFRRNVRVTKEQIQTFLNNYIYSADKIGKVKVNTSFPIS